MSSDSVSDYALKECARIIKGVVQNLKPGFLPALIQKQQRVALWGSTSNACSIPELAKPCTYQDFKGGLSWGNILILQETSFDCDERGNAWIGRVLVHEFNHAVNGVFKNVDSSLQQSLEQAYDYAKANGLWPKDEYAMVSNAEYFAIGAQTWFEANEKRHCDMNACDRGQLEKKDKKLYDVVSKVYQAPNWLYKCDQECNKDGQPQCCITAYEDINYAGQSKQFCGAVTYLGNDWNDRISSIKIQSGCVVEIYDNRDYQGEEKILGSDFPSLGGTLNMNDRISSLKARPA